MSYIGITPSEDSSGQRRRQGAITKTGNEACRRAIIEAAWQYRLPARITPHIRKRHHGHLQLHALPVGPPQNTFRKAAPLRSARPSEPSPAASSNPGMQPT